MGACSSSCIEGGGGSFLGTNTLAYLEENKMMILKIDNINNQEA
jgi:hypothetical protein